MNDTPRKLSGLQRRIVDFLKEHSEGVDDDLLAAELRLSRRQTANAYCRRLDQMGMIMRRSVHGKIRNFLVRGAAAQAEVMQDEPEPTDKPWHWEGNVQQAVVSFLRSEKYTVKRTSDTATKERGKDIEAEKNGVSLWVTVKGYPVGTERTQPSTQAGHWFKDALFDVLVWRGVNPDAQLSVALPHYPRYRSLAEKVSWLQPLVRFSFLWVAANGRVSR